MNVLPLLRAATAQALTAYHADVVTGQFPSEAFSPYKIAADESAQLLRDLEREGLHSAAEVVADMTTEAA